jgi:hypothetical protein
MIILTIVGYVFAATGWLILAGCLSLETEFLIAGIVGVVFGWQIALASLICLYLVGLMLNKLN